jgi:hypothetical protein
MENNHKTKGLLMDPLNSPTSQHFRENFEALINVGPSQGICIHDGRVTPCKEKTSPHGAEIVARICAAKFSEVREISLQVKGQGICTKENGRRIVSLFNDLRNLESGFKNLRSSGGEIAALLILDTAHEHIESAGTLLKPLESAALDLLADQLPPCGSASSRNKTFIRNRSNNS